MGRAGLDRIGVLIPRDGTLGWRPFQVYDDDGVIRPSRLPEYAESTDGLDGSIQLHQGERAIYSARQDRIFIAGGGSSLRTYDVGLDRYQVVALDRNLSPTTGGLTLDTSSNMLYTLEIQWADKQGHDTASVFQCDVGSGSSRQLLSIPWTGTYERTVLIADTADTLILMGSKGYLTESWRFLVHEGGALEQIGQRTDEGLLFNEPHHSSRNAVLPLNDEIFIREIRHQGFVAGDGLTTL